MNRINIKINHLKKRQRGAILIFSLLILAVIMSITFAVMGIFIPKLRIAADPIKSLVAYTTAESGLEWCLYINRGGSPVPMPVFSSGATLNIYYPSSGFNIATCLPAESPLDHRAVGEYQGVARSLQISE